MPCKSCLLPEFDRPERHHSTPVQDIAEGSIIPGVERNFASIVYWLSLQAAPRPAARGGGGRRTEGWLLYRNALCAPDIHCRPMAVPMPAPRRDGPEKASVPGASVWPARETPASTTTEFHRMKGGESAAGCRAETQPSTASSAVDRHVAAWRFGGRRCARRQTSRTKPFRSGRMQHMAIRLHKLVVPWLLICPPVWAARLPVPPVPPSVPRRLEWPKFRATQPRVISTKAVWSRKTPIPPIPPPSWPNQLRCLTKTLSLPLIQIRHLIPK